MNALVCRFALAWAAAGRDWVYLWQAGEILSLAIQPSRMKSIKQIELLQDMSIIDFGRPDDKKIVSDELPKSIKQGKITVNQLSDSTKELTQS